MNVLGIYLADTFSSVTKVNLPISFCLIYPPKMKSMLHDLTVPFFLSFFYFHSAQRVLFDNVCHFSRPAQLELKTLHLILSETIVN